MGDKTAILSAAARNNHIVVPVAFPIAIARLDQLSFSFVPINLRPLEFGKVARRANSIIVESDSGTLIGNRAAFAELNGFRQVILFN